MSRKKWLGLAGGVLAAGALGWLAFRGQTHPLAQAPLGDGTFICLEQISFGRRHPGFTWHRGWRKMAARLLPSKWASRAGLIPYHEKNTDEDSCVMWVTRFDPGTETFPDLPSLLSCEVVDDAGNVSPAQSGSVMGAGMAWQAHAFTFTSYPRRQQSFLVRWRDSTKKVLLEARVENKGPRRFPAWPPEPLPASRTNRDVVVTLRSVQWSGTTLAADCEVLEKGRRVIPARKDAYWEDATGNHPPMSTGEAAWRLKLGFADRLGAPLPAVEVLSLTNLALPAAGTCRTLRLWKTLEGQALWVAAVAGPGSYTWSNGVLAACSPAMKSTYPTLARCLNPHPLPTLLEYWHDKPHLLLFINPLPRQIELRHRAVISATGREVEVREMTHEPARILALDAPPGATAVSLELSLRPLYQFEFFVKPPPRAAEKRP
jgi:hypothetical protein